MYSLTLQPAIDKPLDLRRYMDKFDISRAGPSSPANRPMSSCCAAGSASIRSTPPPTPTSSSNRHAAHRPRFARPLVDDPALATPRQIVNSISGYL